MSWTLFWQIMILLPFSGIVISSVVKSIQTHLTIVRAFDQQKIAQLSDG